VPYSVNRLKHKPPTAQLRQKTIKHRAFWQTVEKKGVQYVAADATDIAEIFNCKAFAKAMAGVRYIDPERRVFHTIVIKKDYKEGRNPFLGIFYNENNPTNLVMLMAIDLACSVKQIDPLRALQLIKEQPHPFFEDKGDMMITVSQLKDYVDFAICLWTSDVKKKNLHY